MITATKTPKAATDLMSHAEERGWKVEGTKDDNGDVTLRGNKTVKGREHRFVAKWVGQYVSYEDYDRYTVKFEEATYNGAQVKTVNALRGMI